jgi:hypothetical protein
MQRYENLIVDYVREETLLENAKKKLKAAENKLKKNKNSKSYKLGRALTWAPRKVKKKIK